MTRDQCSGFLLHPKETFYPVSWSDWLLYFDANQTEHTLKLAMNSTAIHVWNDRSYNIWNKTGGDNTNAYQQIAAEFCPDVYSASKYF